MAPHRTPKAKTHHLGPSTDPVAGMSMLKTSIELGDVGQFAIKPSRVPVLSGRQPFQTSRRQRFQGSYRHRPSANGSAANLLDQANRPSNYTGSDSIDQSHHAQTPDFFLYQTRRQHRKTSANQQAMNADEQRAHSLTPSSIARQTIHGLPTCI